VKALNSKTRKGTQTTFYKVMAVSALAYASEVSAIIKNTGGKNSEMNFLALQATQGMTE
jgi:hypothetical protein